VTTLWTGEDDQWQGMSGDDELVAVTTANTAAESDDDTTVSNIIIIIIIITGQWSLYVIITIMSISHNVFSLNYLSLLELLSD